MSELAMFLAGYWPNMNELPDILIVALVFVVTMTVALWALLRVDYWKRRALYAEALEAARAYLAYQRKRDCILHAKRCVSMMHTLRGCIWVRKTSISLSAHFCGFYHFSDLNGNLFWVGKL